MNERIYNTMRNTGASSLVLGIVTIVTGVAIGVIMIVHGAKLLKEKGKLMI